MSVLIFANNAKTTLSSALTNSATTVNVASGTGSLFPSPTGTQYFVLTLVDAATGLLNEIMWCTYRSGDSLTVIRGQEGTTAKSWLLGDYVNCFPTAGTQATFVQPDQVQQGIYGFAMASGTVNALSATVASDLTSMPDGMPMIVESSGANTGAVTLNLTMGSTITGVFPIVKGSNSALVAGDIPIAGYPIQLNWSATLNSWVMQNPALGIDTIPTGVIFTFPCTTAPAGYLITEGQLISRTTYAKLWAFAQSSGNIAASDGAWVQGQFSPGDGSTTFRLPQLGGYFIRTLDNGNGIDTGRLLEQYKAVKMCRILTQRLLLLLYQMVVTTIQTICQQHGLQVILVVLHSSQVVPVVVFLMETIPHLLELRLQHQQPMLLKAVLKQDLSTLLIYIASSIKELSCQHLIMEAQLQAH